MIRRTSKPKQLKGRKKKTMKKHPKQHKKKHMAAMTKAMKKGKTFTQANKKEMRKVGK